LYEDEHIRRSLPATGLLPTAPGALLSIVPPVTDNDVYNVDGLKLIFFDSVLWGSYRGHLKRLAAAPHNTDLHENFRHFAARYAAASQAGRGRWLRGERASFQTHYENHIANAAETLARQMARLEMA